MFTHDTIEKLLKALFDLIWDTDLRYACTNENTQQQHFKILDMIQEAIELEQQLGLDKNWGMTKSLSHWSSNTLVHVLSGKSIQIHSFKKKDSALVHQDEDQQAYFEWTEFVKGSCLWFVDEDAMLTSKPINPEETQAQPL